MDYNKKDLKYLIMCESAANIFSTCSKKKYAAILLDDNNHVVGMGYNGSPSGYAHCDDGGCPRAIENSQSGSIYDNCISIHAEQNALLHSDYSSKPTKLYVNGPPCFTCAKLISNSTVKTVYCVFDQSYVQWESIKNFLIQNNKKIVEIEKWQLAS